MRGTAIRRDETRSLFREQSSPASGLRLPSHLWVPENARYRRITRFNHAIGLTTFLESLLIVPIDPGRIARLDFIGIETSNFGLFGDDEDIEYRLLQSGTLVPGFEKWTGLTQPLRDPIRQQLPVDFAAGTTVSLVARLIPLVEGGAGDGINSFDVRAELGFWFIPT